MGMFAWICVGEYSCVLCSCKVQDGLGCVLLISVDFIPCCVRCLVAKGHVSTILDSPLGKATVKAESITDSEEERVAADKSFSTKDKSVGREWESVEGRGTRGMRRRRRGCEWGTPTRVVSCRW